MSSEKLKAWFKKQERKEKEQEYQAFLHQLENDQEFRKEWAAISADLDKHIVLNQSHKIDKRTQKQINKERDLAEVHKLCEDLVSLKSQALRLFQVKSPRGFRNKSKHSSGLHAGSVEIIYPYDWKIRGLTRAYILWQGELVGWWHGFHEDIDRPIHKDEILRGGNPVCNIIVANKNSLDVETGTFKEGCHLITLFDIDGSINIASAPENMKNAYKNTQLLRQQALGADSEGSTGRVKNPLNHDLYDVYVVREKPFTSMQECRDVLGIKHVYGSHLRHYKKSILEQSDTSFDGRKNKISAVASLILRRHKGPAYYDNKIGQYIDEVFAYLHEHYQELLVDRKIFINKHIIKQCYRFFGSFDIKKIGRVDDCNFGAYQDILDNMEITDPKVRQMASGAITAENRANQTLEKILGAVKALQTDGMKITQASVAQKIDMSTRWVAKRWPLVQKYLSEEGGDSSKIKYEVRYLKKMQYTIRSSKPKSKKVSRKTLAKIESIEAVQDDIRNDIKCRPVDQFLLPELLTSDHELSFITEIFKDSTCSIADRDCSKVSLDDGKLIKTESEKNIEKVAREKAGEKYQRKVEEWSGDDQIPF